MNYAIILSGGVGTRMRSDGFPKQYLMVHGKPVLMYALEPFFACDRIDRIVIAAHDNWKAQIRQWLEDAGVTKPVEIVSNGETRQGSLLNGLLACAANKTPDPEDKVLVHEAVRPLVTVKIINDCIDALEQYDSCLPVVPIHDSTYITEDRITVADTIDRDRLICGQAPEGFRLKWYLKLNQNTSVQELSQIRGSAELSLRNGGTVGLVEGDHNNFKLTRPDDLKLFQAHLLARQLEEAEQ